MSKCDYYSDPANERDARRASEHTPQVDAINRIADILAERDRVFADHPRPTVSDHEANRTIEFNKGYRQGRADAGGLVAETEGYEKGWHDGHTAGYELGYNDAFNVAANADENTDLRTQALEMAIAAHVWMDNIANTITTTAAAFLHFLETGTPYTSARVLNDDLG